ncbi:MAG: ATP synthase F1 subunit delta [Calditrichota bacterium]
MNLSQISRKYATALYEIAEEHQRLKEVRQGLEQFAAVGREHPELRHLLESFRIQGVKKAEIFRELFATTLDELVLNTVATMLKNQRAAQVAELLPAFREEMRIRQNIASVQATTAVPLSQALRAQIQQSLEKQLHQQIELVEQVDSSLIGGIRLQVNNTVYDGTIAHQLEKLGNSLR